MPMTPIKIRIISEMLSPKDGGTLTMFFQRGLQSLILYFAAEGYQTL